MRNLLIALVLLAVSAHAASGTNDLAWLEPYNVVWDSQSTNAAGSMPCGGRDIGLNVWVENGDVLFYMQRSGSIAEDDEYLKLGRVRVRLTPNPFAGGAFRQELKLEEGLVEITGQTTNQGEPLTATLKIWTEIDRSIVHVEMDSNRGISVDAAYESWRLSDESLPVSGNRRRSCFTFDQYPGTITLSKDTVERVGDAVRFYHRNPNNAQAPGIMIAQQGLQAYTNQIGDDILGRTFGGMMLGDGFVAAGETNGVYQGLAFNAWHLASQSAITNCHLRVVTHIAQTDGVAEWQTNLQSLVSASATDIESARTTALSWWAEFWRRSWIRISPDSPDPSSKAWRAARNYNLFRYQLGCNAFGEYPTKFNGGNFTVDATLINGNGFGPDWRDWGGGIFTAQNQRLLYWPMLKTGDFDAMLPQFELYRKALGGAKARVTKNFGHNGAMYSEYIGVPGFAVGSGWGWTSGSRGRGTEIPFGDPRANANRGYNDLVEAGVMANQSVSYHWESQLEHAYMIMEYNRFTGADISSYMPFIENALIFFDEHYRARQQMRNGSDLNSQGKLVLYPSTACETYRGASNTVDAVSGLRACLESILQLDTNLLSLRDKTYYQTFLNTVPDYPFGQISGQPVMKPAESYMSVKNVEAPQFYPLFPFNRFDLMGNDKSYLQTFRNTWDYDTTITKGMVQSWHQDGIFFARMGRTEDAVNYNLAKLDDNGTRRFPTFWGPGHDWVPDHNWGGSGMLGLQEMLMQTFGDKIYLFPAWPADWDVDFKLHAPKQTTIEGRFRNGVLEQLIVTPASRQADVQVLDVSPLPSTSGIIETFDSGFPGSAGQNGWSDAWAYGGISMPVITFTNPLNAGGNYLTFTQTSTTDSYLRRSYAGKLTASGDETIRCLIRPDALSGFTSVNDYLTLTDGPSSAGGSSSASSFIIRVFGASPSGSLPARRWGLYNGQKNAGSYNAANWVDSGMSIETGKTYAFSLVLHPAALTYDVKISNGTTSVTKTNLGFRDNSFTLPNTLIFNAKIGNATNILKISIDTITVSPLPVPVPKLSGVSVDGPNFSFSFPGEPGETYLIERASSLTPPTGWETIATIIGTNGLMLALAGPATNAAGFFRLRVQ